MVILIGLYGLVFGTKPFVVSAPPKEINKWIPLFLVLFAGAWLSYDYLWRWLATVLLFVAGMVLFQFIEGYLVHFDIRSKENRVFGLLVMVTVPLLYLSSQADFREIEQSRLAGAPPRKEPQAREAVVAEHVAVESIRKEQTFWRPGWDVSEAGAGPVLAFLAAVETVSIDWDYEMQLEQTDGASRRIPIKVVLLNNSFEDVRLAALSGQAISGRDEHWLWRVWITRQGSGRVVREWVRELPAPETLLFPIEKAEFDFDWDGRDDAGRLVPQGEYGLRLRTASVLPECLEVEITREIRIVDAGPVEIYKPDPALERLRAVERQRRLLEDMHRERQRWDKYFHGMQRDIVRSWQRPMLQRP
jgi:hypothetical protein